MLKQASKTNPGRPSPHYYDDAVKTICVRAPSLLIPLWNEAFGLGIPLDAIPEGLSFDQRPMGHEGSLSPRQADSVLLVTMAGLTLCFLTEFEAVFKKRLGKRVPEYAINHGVEHNLSLSPKGSSKIDAPYSCVVVLKAGGSIPERIDATLSINGTSQTYPFPVIASGNYTAKQIVEKDLYVLMPFHALHYAGKLDGKDRESVLKKAKEAYRMLAEGIQKRVSEGTIGEYEAAIALQMTLETSRRGMGKHPDLQGIIEEVINMRGRVLDTIIDQREREVTQRVTKDVTERVTKDVTEQVTKDVTKKVTEDVTKKVTNDVTKKVTRNVTKKVKAATKNTIIDNILKNPKLSILTDEEISTLTNAPVGTVLARRNMLMMK